MVDYKIFDRDKFTIVGTPTVTDEGIASGFSTSSYLKSILVDFTKPFKIKFRSNLTDTTTSNQGTILALTGYGDFNNVIKIYTTPAGNSKYMLSFIKNGVAHNTQIVFDINKYYDFIFEWTGQTYYLYAKSENDNEYIKHIEFNDDTPITYSSVVTNQDVLAIGTRIYQQQFLGSIDLKQFIIEVDGKEVFSGSHNANVAEKLRYLKDSKEIIRQSIEAKGVEVPIETPFRQYADKIEEISGGGGEIPSREDINLYTSGSVNVGVFQDGIMVAPYGTYTCAIANKYNDSTVTIPLNKTLDHYEINLKLQPFYQKESKFGAICWRGLNECGFINSISYTYGYEKYTMVAKYNYNSSIGDTLYFKPTSPILIKYVFNSNNLTTVTFKTDDSNSVTTTYTVGTPRTMTSVANMYIFGDSGDPNQAYTRHGVGKLYFEGTYVRDLDTGNIVWELCNGYNN